MSTLETRGDALQRKQEPPKQQEYEFHPIANVFPLMVGDEFKRLKEDIKIRKQQEPIIIHEGKILDGRNRYNACKQLGILVGVKQYEGDDPVGFVLSANLHRRHLNESQRAMVAAKLASLKVGANQHTKEGLSIERASKLSTASEATANRCRKVLSDGVPELAQMIEKGQVAASLAEAVAKLPKEKQAELVKKTPTAFKEAAKEATAKGETLEDLSDGIDKLVDALIDKLKKLRTKKLGMPRLPLLTLFGDCRQRKVDQSRIGIGCCLTS
ncbi:MAG TPA: ParB/RepB/Spo0J family partition protein [Xanthobacteraceae bacterium]|nr:ParB/RepB/Spo0J family partition protein [Xanthobacteraceae bacterium]